MADAIKDSGEPMVKIDRLAEWRKFTFRCTVRLCRATTWTVRKSFLCFEKILSVHDSV